MSDVTTSLRAQEINERTQSKVLQAHAGAAVQAAQAIFPGDQVDLSPAAKEAIAGGASETTDSTAHFRDAVRSGANQALSEVTARLNRLMSVYGVTANQTNIAGNRVVDAIRNEVRRVIGTIDPPLVEMQVRQELNFIVHQMEVKVDLAEDLNTDPTVSVEIGSATMEYTPEGPTGGLLVTPGTLGVDESGNTVDLSQAKHGLFFSATGSSLDTNGSGISALDRYSGRLAAATGNGQSSTAAALPDINQDGARNEADRNGAVLIVQGGPTQNRQAETGLAQFIADLAVPIAVRASEAVPSRLSRRNTID
ncbi:MAG: hypothetical protein JXQ84_07350 [Rhodospirillaceae bacterium]|nr:hypothetical protein [Rhodospirillaceae bacterium]